MPAHEALLIAEARRSVRAAKKMRVLKFIRMPWQLDMLFPDLSHRSGAQIVEIAHWLIERETTRPRRHIGLGGEIPMLNAQAVLLLGRALRLHERRFVLQPV